MVFIALALKLRGLLNSSTKSKVHTHDRLDGKNYNLKESDSDHYIKQLDGFLQAGIIDRSEYKTLRNRYKR